MQSFILILREHWHERRNHSFHVVRLRHYSNMKAFDPKNYFYTVHFLDPFNLRMNVVKSRLYNEMREEKCA
jgi:hypothetical protein